jgi:hypothetical protein
MNKVIDQKDDNSKQATEKNEFNESAELHRGQKYIPSKTDPELAIAFSISQQSVM